MILGAKKKTKKAQKNLCAFFYEKRETGSYAIVPFGME